LLLLWQLLCLDVPLLSEWPPAHVGNFSTRHRCGCELCLCVRGTFNCCCGDLSLTIHS
jgi:hypothetical protein